MKELILVFDQDWSTMTMSVRRHPNGDKIQQANDPTAPERVSKTSKGDKPNLVGRLPTERTIIALWKRAAKSPGVLVVDAQNGLCCQLDVAAAATSAVSNDIHSTPPQTVAAKPSLDGTNSSSKRSVLEYLQATCSMEFLRQHKYVCVFVILTRVLATS